MPLNPSSKQRNWAIWTLDPGLMQVNLGTVFVLAVTSAAVKANGFRRHLHWNQSDDRDGGWARNNDLEYSLVAVKTTICQFLANPRWCVTLHTLVCCSIIYVNLHKSIWYRNRCNSRKKRTEQVTDVALAAYQCTPLFQMCASPCLH